MSGCYSSHFKSSSLPQTMIFFSTKTKKQQPLVQALLHLMIKSTVIYTTWPKVSEHFNTTCA